MTLGVQLRQASVFASAQQNAAVCENRCGLFLRFVVFLLFFYMDDTLAGAWIQMAGLNRMWSHSCLRSKMPFCKLLRYLEKASTMSRTGRVTCTLED